MTRDEAEARAKQLQAEHPDRETHRFVAREHEEGVWEVAKVPIPEQLRRPGYTETIG
jgi:hypothetical protein